MKNFMQCIAVLMAILFFSQAAAADKVVVIPPDSEKKTLLTVVTVAAGDADFTDPAAAVNSITDASAAKPYLVQIDAGVYTLTQTLIMKPFVHIAGAGKDATTLTGAISTVSYDASSALVSGADNATLCDLTIENTGGGAIAIAIYNNSSPTIQDVIVTASGGRHNYGVYNEYPSAPSMIEVTASASGGTYNYDVYNSSP
ncbi:MAG: pectinesterase [Desulfobulbaceae bacterium]